MRYTQLSRQIEHDFVKQQTTEEKIKHTKISGYFSINIVTFLLDFAKLPSKINRVFLFSVAINM